MPIINKTKDEVIAETFEECRTTWQQTKGMMFRKEVVPLVFYFSKERIVKLHSWFCPDAMDLVFLDENWEVVETVPVWPKKSSYTAKTKFMFLLELPKETIYRTNIEVGDLIHIIK